MNITAEQLLSGAMELPPTMLAFMAEKLIENLNIDNSTGISEQWKQTINRRCKEMDKSVANMIDANWVFTKAHIAL